jgi:hypothetical protein
MNKKRTTFSLIAYLVLILITGLTIDWEAVREYNQEYPNPAQMGACPPTPPCHFQQTVFWLLIVLSIPIFIISLTIHICKGDKI